MTWTKLSDDFTDDCEQLDDDAFRLHVEGLVWSNRKLRDCLIPKEDLRRFASNPDAVHKLLALGWWEDRGNAYEVVHHAIYQESSDKVLARQKRSRENGAKGGRPPGPPREHQPRNRNRNTQNGTHLGSAVNPDGLAAGLSQSERTPSTEPAWGTRQPTQEDGPGEAVNVTTHVGGEKHKTCNRCGRNPRAGDLDRPGWCRVCIRAECEELERRTVRSIRDGYDR